jgi:signal transduction histidine kinase
MNMSMELVRPGAAGASNEPAAAVAAGAVHDLGNLIQLASSAIGIIGRSPEVRDGRLATLAASAHASLDRAGLLVRQSLDRARRSLDSAPSARLADCLAEVDASMRGALQTGIRLDIRIDPDLPDIACDPLGLQCAILNLVFNAREAMGGRGLIRLRAERRPDSDALVDVRVIDSGVGMSSETVMRAFDPFFTTKSDGLGGLGLPMVERFARACGGTVFIESRLGVGTTVVMRLPLAPAAPAQQRRELDR